MNLVKFRDEIRGSIQNLGYLDSQVLEDYKANRDSESWRTSRMVEELCEYILYLEEKNKNCLDSPFL